MAVYVCGAHYGTHLKEEQVRAGKEPDSGSVLLAARRHTARSLPSVALMSLTSTSRDLAAAREEAARRGTSCDGGTGTRVRVVGTQAGWRRCGVPQG